MKAKIERLQNRAEHTMVSLLILLFYISLIESYRLLGITGFFIIIYSITKCEYKAILKMVKSVLPLVVLLILPSIIRYTLNGTLEDLDFTIIIISKVLLSIILLGTIVSKHSALYLVDGILNIGLPTLLNRILALTFRYFYMINEDVQKGGKALNSRGIKERKGFSSLSIWGEWIGGFFLKSAYHSDMVFNAMKARGFKGEARNEKFKNKRLIIESCILIIFLAAVLIIDWKV